jgi:ABC-2 type transport system ATP-binding protein
LELVERLCDRVALIDRGRIVAAGGIEELRASRERRRFRVEVAGARYGWFEAIPGVRVSERVPGGVILDLDDSVDEQRVLDLARAEGDVMHFSRVRPTLAELFREVVRS